MKKTILPLVMVLGLFAAGSSYGATASISFTSGTAIFTDSTGTALPDGSLISLGTTSDLAGMQAIASGAGSSAAKYAAASALFTSLAEGNVGGGSVSQAQGALPNAGGTSLIVNSSLIGSAAGSSFGSITGWSNAYLAAGTQLYLWVFNSTSGRGDASEWGIYTSSDVAWLSPDADTATTKFLLGSQVNQPAGWGTVDTAANPDELATASILVPEPSRAVLALLGFVVCAVRRRR